MEKKWSKCRGIPTRGRGNVLYCVRLVVVVFVIVVVVVVVVLCILMLRSKIFIKQEGEEVVKVQGGSPPGAGVMYCIVFASLT